MKSIATKHSALFVLLALTLLSLALFPARASANSAEPPAILVVVLNAPEDMELFAQVNGELIPMQLSSSAWERYYKLHHYDFPGLPGDVMPAALVAVSGGETKSVPMPALADTYNNVYTLDYASMKLTEGTLPFRAALLTAMRVTLTLVLEGLVFYLFGFRAKRSWVAFFIINLATQGALNLVLSLSAFSSGYAVLALIILEIFVFLVEIPAFLLAVKEKRWWQRLLYALAANTASLLLGGVLIMFLPV